MDTTTDRASALVTVDSPALLDPSGCDADCSSTNDGSLPPEECTDPQLVSRCLGGDQHAWAALINRYKRLIYSFPRRYGATAADAADVFQLVCAELFRALPTLRNHGSLRSWIMTVAAHQAYQWKRRWVQQSQRECEDAGDGAPHARIAPSDALEQRQRDAAVRKAIAQLPPRCRTLVQKLFFQDPPVAYQDLAVQLGLATGSIGLTRTRCLKRLERTLADAGVV